MKNVKNEPLRLGLIATGAIFLFNPTINILDPLPDLIGFWMIAYALTAVAYLSEHMYEARKNFVYLAFLEGAKLLVNLTVPGTSGSFLLLMTFCFVVLEMILFLPAVGSLFEGISSMGTRHGAPDSFFYVPLSKGKMRKTQKLLASVTEAKTPKDKELILKKIDKISKRMSLGGLKIFTILAFLVRQGGAILPTLPNLKLYGDAYFVTSGQINWSQFVGIFYILSWIAGFSVCIPWLCKFRAYWRSMGNYVELEEKLYSKYATEVLTDKGRLYADLMQKVMIIGIVACCATFTFPVDNVNFVPNFITAGLVIAALVYLIPFGKRYCVAGIVASSLWAVVSAVGIWLQSDYKAMNYDPAAAVAFGGEGRGAAKELYFRMEIFSYIEAALFLVTALIFAYVFVQALKGHIGIMPPRMDGMPRDEKKLTKCLKPVAISGGVVILFNFVLTFVTKWFAGAWIINMAAVIVLAVFAIRAYYSLLDNVYIPLKRKF